MLSTSFRYVVVRYMLNELADEAANVGVIAVATDPPRMITRFLDNPAAKSRADVKVQKHAVERFAAFVAKQKTAYEARGGDNPAEAAANALNNIREFGSGVIRTNMVRSVLTNNIDAEVELLYNQWVKPGRAIARRTTGPRDPLGTIRRKATTELVKAFRAGYGSLTRQIFHRGYEVEGAVHTNRIDLAMVHPNGGKSREYLFQHVLLFPDAEETFTQAAGLCWRWDDIRETNHIDRELTAVLYEKPGQEVRGVNDATELLRQSKVQVTRLAELPRLARGLKGEFNFEI